MKPDFQTWFETKNPEGTMPSTAMSMRIQLEQAYTAGADSTAKLFVEVGQFLSDGESAKISFVPFVDGSGITLKHGDPVYVLCGSPVGKSVIELKQDLACAQLDLATARANQRRLEDLVLELGRQLDDLAVKTGAAESPYNTSRLLCELQNKRILHNGFNLHGTRTGRISAAELNESNWPAPFIEVDRHDS